MSYQSSIFEGWQGDSLDQALNSDQQLPALPLAFDRSAVARLFAQHWPGPNESLSCPVAIQPRRRLSVSYQPAQRCVVAYELLAQHQASAPESTIGVVEITPAGCRHRLFWDDPQMPWLLRATDAAAMLERLSALAQVPGQVQVDRITAVRYKPGQRCILRYDLHMPNQKRCLWGKVFAQDAEPLLATLCALHEATRTNPRLPRVPQPLAYVPDLHMLVQAAIVDGKDLHSLAFDPGVPGAARERYFFAIGAHVAALHKYAQAPGSCRALLDDVQSLHEYGAAIAQLAPELLEPFERAIGMIQALAADRPEPPFVASHGACRTDQWMVSGDSLVMLDLDGFCWANPARDLANVLAYLRWKAIRQPEHAAFIDRAERALLEAYASIRPRPDPRWLALYKAASLLKIAGRRFRSLAVDEWSLVPALLSAAESLAQRSAESLVPVESTATRRSLAPLPDKPVPSDSLPMLGAALDIDRVRGDLEGLLKPLARADATPTITGAAFIGGKPGSRAVIEYAVAGLGPGQSHVIGKVYCVSEQAERVNRTMQMLWSQVFGAVPAATIPQPLGVIPRLGLLAYLRADGQPLSEVMLSSLGNAALTLAAVWLRMLHQQQLALDKRFDLATELANLQSWADLVGATWPACSADAQWIACQLGSRASTLHFEIDVPIHKDFQPEHVLFNRGVTVLDFDEMRLGDPVFDLAHFCANLHLLAPRLRLSHEQLAALQTRFLDAYAQENSWHADERWAFFYAYTCIKIAKQLCALRGMHPRPEGAEQQRQVQAILAYGRAMLQAESPWLYLA